MNEKQQRIIPALETTLASVRRCAKKAGKEGDASVQAVMLRAESKLLMIASERMGQQAIGLEDGDAGDNDDE